MSTFQFMHVDDFFSQKFAFSCPNFPLTRLLFLFSSLFDFPLPFMRLCVGRCREKKALHPLFMYNSDAAASWTAAFMLPGGFGGRSEGTLGFLMPVCGFPRLEVCHRAIDALHGCHISVVGFLHKNKHSDFFFPHLFPLTTNRHMTRPHHRLSLYLAFRLSLSLQGLLYMESNAPSDRWMGRRSLLPTGVFYSSKKTSR
jgi:hypothetical protein